MSKQVSSIEIQSKANSLFGAFFSKQVLYTEVIKYQDETGDHSVASVISILRADAEKSRTPFKLYATQFVIQAVDALIGKPSDCKANFFYLITSKLASQEEIYNQKVQQRVNNHPVVTPFPLIVKLDRVGVISLIHYFQSCAECTSKISAWVDYLFTLACSPPNPQDSDLLNYLLTAVLNIGFGELSPDLEKTLSGQTVKVAVSLLNELTRKMWDFLWEFPEKEVHAFQCLVDSQQVMFCQLSSLQRCYLEQLSFIISYKPEIKPITAIKSQHEWSFFKSPKNVINFLTQLLVPLEAEKILDKIDEILNRYEINWKNLLLIISTVQVCYPTGNKNLKALINSLMQRALQNSQMELLLASFLLARQINAEHTSGTHYGAWFSSITSSSTTSKQFAFLLKFLSNIARHEPEWVLRAHRNPPFIPMIDNCRSLWTDYSSLVRTRLEDLKSKQSTDQIVEEDAIVVKEVETAIATFEKSGRIPNAVIEAAIFRKPYFVNKFLPSLLKPRRVPNPPDAREDLVEELKKSGKLPGSHYEAYLAACQQLQQMKPENENMDWQTSEGKPNYEILMDSIRLCKDVRQQSQIIEQLDGILGSLLPSSDSSTNAINFNPDANEVTTRKGLAWKIAEIWIQSIKTTCLTDETNWMNRYFLLLCRYPTFVESLYTITWDFIHKCSEHDDSVRCYAIIILLLFRNSHILPPVHYKHFRGSYGELLMKEDQLVFHRKESLVFHLRLLYYTVMAAKHRSELSSVRLASSLYLWLCRRILHSSKMSEFRKYLGMSRDVELLEMTDLSAKKWLRLEMTVRADADVLSWSERSGYLQSVLSKEYQEVPRMELCVLILDAIMRDMLRNLPVQADSSKDLLLLLQYLVYNDESVSSELSVWLVEYWLKLRNEQGSGIDPLMWSVACFLPPYLLSRNSFQQPILEGSLQTLANLIENEWRNTVTSECACLPKHVTIHLLRALEGSLPDIPCLHFSSQMHRIHDIKAVAGVWKSLDKALDVFHPLTRDLHSEETIQWSGLTEVDLLASQLITVASVTWCTKGNSDKWPQFIEELARKILANPGLLNAWKMPYWIGEDSKLPWMRILPTCLLNLLPFVILQVLISWSDLLLPTLPDYLDAVVTAHNQWIQTTHSFIDSAVGYESQSNYPVGQILDFCTLGRMASNVEQILERAPIRSLKLLQQYSCFRTMETDYQALVRKRCS